MKQCLGHQFQWIVTQAFKFLTCTGVEFGIHAELIEASALNTVRVPDAVARCADFVLRWGGVSELAMKDACVDAVTDPEYMTLARLIRLNAKQF